MMVCANIRDMASSVDLSSKAFEGALIGLATGDAVGSPVEFMAPGTFAAVTDMGSGGAFSLQAGQWTDDTSMALCMAASLVEKHEYDSRDIMDKWVKWLTLGYMSSTGVCFDIGTQTHTALKKYKANPDAGPYTGDQDQTKCGNGSLMRLVPIPLFFANNPKFAIEMAADSSRTTHPSVRCMDACRYYAGLIVGALRKIPKEELLSARFSPDPSQFIDNPLCKEIDEIAAGSFKVKQPPEIIGSGYVVKSLEAALWGFYHSSSYEEGLLKVVNLGNDADTTGAIYGQLAGAFYGIDGIPSKWVSKLAHKELLFDLSNQLYDVAIIQK